MLACVELLAGEFTFLMLAGGALAGSVAAFNDTPLWGVVTVFAVVSVGLIVFLRPALRRWTTSPMALDTSAQALVGTRARVVEDVTGHEGQIRLDGSLWSARSVDGASVYKAGSNVTVSSIDGATAIVWKDEE